METTSAPLTHCPMCQYDLTGLPKDHHCPECGFEYDASMRVWIAPPARWWSYIPALGLCLAFTLRGWFHLFFSEGWWTAAGALSVSFWTPLFGFLIWTARRRLHLVVSDTGFVLTRYIAKPLIRTWADVWVPDRDLRLQLPPWAQERNSELEKRGVSHLEAALCRERDWVWTRDDARIFLRPRRRWFGMLRSIRLNPVQRLPRKKREAAMEEIRQRWLRRGAPDGQDES